MIFWHQLNFQDANSLIIENIIFFHDFGIIIIIIILFLIIYILIFIFINKNRNLNLLDGQFIEIIWTIIPIVFLCFLAFPSLKVLYISDEYLNSILNIKILGHQWYWSYEYNLKNLIFDSYLEKDSVFRLLEVDNNLILPINSNVNLFISSTDVIHSFALPRLGLKVDAIPGRLNFISINFNRCGIYYGQCSEICGLNHRFIPICFETVKIKIFSKWIIEV